MFTKQVVADKITAWLRHEITQAQLVAWADEAFCDADFAYHDAPVLMRVVGRLGLADAKELGLGWEACEELLKCLGFTPKVEITAA